MAPRKPLSGVSVDRRRFLQFGAMGAGFLLAGGALTGCSTGTESSGAVADRLVVGTTTSINPLTGLNSSYQTYQYNAFDSLVRLLADASEPEARIATSWTSVDAVTTDFVIRDGVKFHDGTSLTAEDVAFSFTESIEKKFATASILANIDSVVAVDPSTVRVVTKTPEPLLMNILAQVFIVPRAAYLAAGGADGFAKNPIGSGPYRIAPGFDIDNSVTFEAFTDFWGTTAATPTVELRYFSDSSAMAAAFESGQLSIAHELPGSALQTLAGNSDFEITSAFSGSQNMMQFNTAKAPFNDIRVRRAANAAIDSQGLIDALTYGAGTPEAGQLPIKSVFGYTDSITAPEFDKDKARKLLAEAGAEGVEITISGLNLYKPLLEAIGGQLAAVGFKPTIQANEAAVWISQFREGTDADLFFRGTSYTGVFDADRPFSFVSSGKRPMVSDPKWTELYTASRQELDRDAREKKLIACSEYIKEQSYILFTYARPSVGGVTAGTKGVDFTTGIMLRFDQATTTA